MNVHPASICMSCISCMSCMSWLCSGGACACTVVAPAMQATIAAQSARLVRTDIAPPRSIDVFVCERGELKAKRCREGARLGRRWRTEVRRVPPGTNDGRRNERDGHACGRTASGRCRSHIADVGPDGIVIVIAARHAADTYPRGCRGGFVAMASDRRPGLSAGRMAAHQTAIEPNRAASRQGGKEHDQGTERPHECHHRRKWDPAPAPAHRITL